MKLLFLSLLILFIQNSFSQDPSLSTYTIPSKDKLENIDELNKLAIASNGGALGCGVMFIEKDGKQYNMGASLRFMLNEDYKADIEQLHAICYARYANIVLKDTTWPLPNLSLCFTASDVLSVFHNQESPQFLCLLMQDKNRERIAIVAMNKMGVHNPGMRKDLSRCVENHLVSMDYRVSGWIEKEMRQPLLIKIKGKNKVRINRKVFSLEEVKPWLEKYKEEYGDDYVYFGSIEKEEDEFVGNLIQIINAAGYIIADPEDYQ